MTDARWWSQPFAPEGSQAAEGIANQLGRPSLDPLEVLVREAAQNSWDARTGVDRVRFRISLQQLGDRADAWCRLIAPGPTDIQTRGLTEALTPESMVWIVSDRGTVGLGGPIRAGIKAEPDQRSDFVQFMRNVGEPRDTELGGGTYGFGKGIFYRLSGPGVIVANSRAGQGGDRRMMGAAIGNSFYIGERRYTGRHWWGTVNDNVPDPLVGEDADGMGAQLGLPGFVGDETGTDIIVVGAQLGMNKSNEPRTPEEAGTFVASAILWHLWPKLVGEEAVRMHFTVDVDGAEIEIPDPASVDSLFPFVGALQSVRGGSGSQYTRASEPKDVGRLAIEIGVARADDVLEVVEVARPFELPAHHVARMRQAELVVDYREGPLHPNPSLAYGAVFRASIDADSHFAAAEPPTHDDWIEKGLIGTDRGVVQGARHFVEKQLKSRFEGGLAVAGSESFGLAALSKRLGSILDRAPTQPTSRSNGGGGSAGEGGGGSKAGDVRVLEPARLVVDGSAPFLVSRVRVGARASASNYLATAVVKLDGGVSEGAAPLNSATPRIIQWAPVAGGDPVPGPGIRLEPGDDRDWWVYANYIPLAAVDISVRRVD